MRDVQSRPGATALLRIFAAMGLTLGKFLASVTGRDRPTILYPFILIEPSIIEHHGKLVKTTGDGFIAIFDSPVEAVRCSIVIQQNLVGRNASLPKHHWIEYRIGVNLGDVIIETDDVYGDGVNIATRLEGIAHPGEVYISGGIYEQIKHKLVCGYEALGDRKVKNITDPVRVYRVLPDPSALHGSRKRRERILALLLILALLIIAGGTLGMRLGNLASC